MKRLLAVAVVLVLGLAMVAQAVPAQAADPVTVTAKLIGSDGTPLNGGTARGGSGASYWSWWFSGGSTGSGANAPGETTVQLVPGTYSFEMVYAGTDQRKMNVVIDGPTTLYFYTTNVTLQYSNSVAYGAAYGDSAWFKQTPATASKELLGDGQSVAFRLSGTGGEAGRLGLVIPEATTTGVNFTRSLIVLRLVDSNGAALNGGTARGSVGVGCCAYHVPGFTGNAPDGGASGTPNADGILVYALSGLVTNVTNEMKFNNTASQFLTQDASVNSVYQFGTGELTLKLVSSTGVGLAGGRARYGIGASYWTWWFPGGPTNGAGETVAQVMPGTYSFEMIYAGTDQRKISQVIPGGNTTLTFYTTNVTLQYSNSVAYGGAYGDSAWFKTGAATGSRELLGDGQEVAFRLSGTGGEYGRLGLVIPEAGTTGVNFTRSLIVLRLVDSNGAALNGGTAHGSVGVGCCAYFAPGFTGNAPDGGAFGTANADGILVYALSGLVTNVTNEMKFNNTASQFLTQDAAVNSVYLFRTRELTLRLEDHLGSPLAGGGARYGIGGWWGSWFFPGGPTDATGATTAQVFPGTYSFEMRYNNTTEVKASQVIPDADTTLTWATKLVTVELRDGTEALVDTGGNLRYQNGSWYFFDGASTVGGQAFMELFPGTYLFELTNGGITQQKLQDVGANPIVLFHVNP